MESLQSHMILTMSHWSSGLPVCFPPHGSQVQIPWGDLYETGILLLVLSRYNRFYLCIKSLFKQDLVQQHKDVRTTLGFETKSLVGLANPASDFLH